MPRIDLGTITRKRDGTGYMVEFDISRFDQATGQYIKVATLNTHIEPSWTGKEAQNMLKKTIKQYFTSEKEKNKVRQLLADIVGKEIQDVN